MRLQLKSTIAATSVALAGFVPAAKADTVYNNFGPGGAFSASGVALQGPSVGTVGKIDQATSFTTPNQEYRLTDISVGLFVSTGPTIIGTGPFDLEIATDSGGLPGTVLTTLTENATTTGQQKFDASAPGTFVLHANTTYFVILDSFGTFDAGWGYNTTGAVGAEAGRSDNGPWSLNNNPSTDPNLSLEVLGTVYKNPDHRTPEGGSVALLGAAVMGGMAFARRRFEGARA